MGVYDLVRIYGVSTEPCSTSREEWFLPIAGATAIAFLLFGQYLLADLSDPRWLTVVFVWLFAVVLGSALQIVRHADRLAEQLSEPYGTLILRLAITSIEVIAMSAVMI
jgi:Ca2+:H+ antiporter